ncbi:MAG: M48 family metallopeptidase [Massilia sp.]
MNNAAYFDGHSAALHPVQLEVRDGALRIAGAAIALAYELGKLKLAEPFLHAPAVLYLPDGGRCEVSDPQARADLAAALDYKPSLVMRWQRHWYAALAALVVLLGVGAFVWFYAIPRAAEEIAARIPPSLDAQIGASALRGLEKKAFEPSRLSTQRIAQLEAVLAEVSPAAPRHPLRLLVRNAPALGPNALALPDGTIVITDQMVRGIYEGNEFTAEQMHAALAGVLAHEVGHVQRRHSVRVLARSSLTAAASATLFGDFSAVAAGLPAVLANLHYSRAMETEADTYAIDTLRSKGWSTAPLAELFVWLDSVNDASPQKNMPKWMHQSLPYASSHPASAERIARLQAAASSK